VFQTKQTMPRQIPINKIISAAQRGIEKSQKQYLEWSGDFWLWQAPEYLITTNIAKQISNLKGTKYITMENGASAAIKDAGAQGKGRLHNDIRGDGKIDIVLWWADGTPRAIIEVKNQIYYSGQYEKDIKRIKKVLNRKSNESSFQFGLFAFYDSAIDGPQKTATEKVTGKINNIYLKSSKLLGDDFNISLHKSKIHKDNDSAWVAACLLIKK
jgi:hypothetical protein